MATIDQSFTRLAKRLVSQYRKRNDLYRRLDDIFYLRGGIPDGLPNWVQNVKSTEPRDAVMTATRVLSTLMPQFRVNPMLSNQNSRKWANDVEYALRWNYANLSRRPGQKPHWQIVLNSVRYAQPVVQVNYLPYQLKLNEQSGKETNQIKAARKYGDFHYIVHDPSNVYPMWSDFGLEKVLIVRLQTVDAFKETWGAKAAGIDKLLDFSEGTMWVSTFDLWSQDRRIIWGAVAQGEAAKKQELVLDGGASLVILDEPNDLGFIPIAIHRWGDENSTFSDQQVLPLLSGVALAGHWEMLNTLFSLDASLAWKRAAQPVGVHTSATRQPPEMDYTEPASTIELGPGESYQPLPPQSVDAHVAQQYSNFRNLIWQSTVARALQSLEFPGNTAYSTVNQVLQAATQSISPYRILAEDVLADAAHIELCWLSYWGEKYDKDVNLYGAYPRGHDKYGDEIMIPWQELDPYELQVQVILRPDVPLDRQQQVNTAAVLYDRFPIPASAALEDIGFENMEELSERRYQENIDLAYISAEQERPVREVDFEFQARLKELEMQMQQAMLQMQMGAQGGAPGGAPGAPPPQEPVPGEGEIPSMEMMQGMGANPAAGGQPPIQGAPGQATREASPRRGR